MMPGSRCEFDSVEVSAHMSPNDSVRMRPLSVVSRCPLKKQNQKTAASKSMSVPDHKASQESL